jgi:anti-sigma regulatory factor (Ser/Thr protein kinase)
LENSKILTFNISIQSELSELNRLRKFIEENLNFINILDLNRIILAVDEIVSNIIEHGYKLKSNYKIFIDFTITNDNQIIIKIEDNAPHFNILNYTKPDPNKHAEKGKSRGLGLFLVSSIIDQIYYEPKHPIGNINILIKKIQEGKNFP